MIFLANFNLLFKRIDKIPNDRKITHFQSLIKPVQAKGWKVPLNLLAGVNEELKRMENSEECDGDCSMSPFVITRKKDGSINFALDLKLMNEQMFEKKHQMRNIHEMIDLALQLTEKTNGQVWFSNLNLKNAYS